MEEYLEELRKNPLLIFVWIAFIAMILIWLLMGIAFLLELIDLFTLQFSGFRGGSVTHFSDDFMDWIWDLF